MSAHSLMGAMAYHCGGIVADHGWFRLFGGGGLGVAPGEVCYFGPDTLAWGGLGAGQSALVLAAMDGSLGESFANLRWPGWEEEVGALALDQGLSLYPPPWMEQGKDLSKVSRRPVPMAELLGVHADVRRQLDGE